MSRLSTHAEARALQAILPFSSVLRVKRLGHYYLAFDDNESRTVNVGEVLSIRESLRKGGTMADTKSKNEGGRIERAAVRRILTSLVKKGDITAEQREKIDGAIKKHVERSAKKPGGMGK